MKTKDIAKRLQIHESLARSVLRCINSYSAASQSPGGAARIAECYNPPEDVDIQMHAINKLIEGYGVEYIPDKDDTITNICGVEYINMGDTYACTVCYDHSNDRFLLSDWGSLVERYSSRFE